MPKKLGHADDRKAVAAYIRSWRHKKMHGGWTHREWNYQLRIAISNALAKMTSERKAVKPARRKGTL